MIAAAGFLAEYFWPAGDLRWAYVIVSGAITIPLLYSPEIFRWAARKVTPLPEQETQGKVQEDTSPPPYPGSYTWLDKADAFLLIRGSTLVPNVPYDFNKPWTKSEGRERVRANSITFGDLAEFGGACPEAVRDGKYGRETLEWWIGKKIQEQDARIQ